MKNYLDLKLLRGGWISIEIHSDTGYVFENMIKALRSVPVLRWDKHNRRWISSIHHYDFIYRLCKRNNFGLMVTGGIDHYVKRLKYLQTRWKEAKKNKEFSSKFWTEDKELQVLSYQAKAINVCYEAKRYLIGDELGVGKTIEAIGVICKAFESETHTKALIVCMNKLKGQWRREILRFTKFNKSDIVVMDNEKFHCPLNLTEKLLVSQEPCRSCKMVSVCKAEKADPSKYRKRIIDSGKIVILNYEILAKVIGDLIEAKFDIIIADEATKIKNDKAQCSKKLLELSKTLRSDAIVLPMSGKFIENRLEELFMPFSLVDRRIFGEMHNFRNRYMMLDYWNKPIGYKNEEEVQDYIKKYMIRRTQKQVWKDRPKLHIFDKICDMDSNQREIYRKAKDGVIEKLHDMEVAQKINIAHIGALIMYLIQICDTTETIDKTKRYSCKIDYLKELVTEEIPKDEKVIIFSFFANKVIPVIQRELDKVGKEKCLVVTGNTKNPDDVIDKFQNSNDYRYLICSDSLAYGKNLQFVRWLVNFDLPWNPAKLEQRIARVYRKGQKKDVSVFNLITEKTIEDDITQTLINKRALFEKFINSVHLKIKKPSMKKLLSMLKKS